MAGEVLSRDKRLSLRLYDEIIGVKLNCWRDGQHSVCEAFRWLLEERAEFLANEKILTQRAEAAEREVERLKGETVKLRDAYRHYQSVKQQGKSEFIKENGRFGGSSWAELCDSIETLLAAKGCEDGK